MSGLLSAATTSTAYESTVQPNIDKGFIKGSDKGFTTFDPFNQPLPVVDSFTDSVSLKKSPLISDHLKETFEIALQIVVLIVASIFGIVANIVNIIVYRKQSFQESIVLGFFALSISDLIVAAAPLGASACALAKHILPEDTPYQFVGFHFVSTGQLREMAYYFSNILTAFLSLERCCCVVLPFKVKMIFTVKRSRMVIVSLIVFVICGYGPLLTVVQLRWMDDPIQNNTEYFGLWFVPHRKIVHAYTYYLLGILTPAVCVFTVICCSLIMIFGLQASSKFRLAARGKDEPATGMSSRDARLVKVMVFLGAILCMCNLPYLAFVFAIIAEPDLEQGNAYTNTYELLYILLYIFSLINASSNMFVYYTNSTRYRQICNETFSCLSSKTVKDST